MFCYHEKCDLLVTIKAKSLPPTLTRSAKLNGKPFLSAVVFMESEKATWSAFDEVTYLKEQLIHA